MVASIQSSSASVNLISRMTATHSLQNWDEMVKNEQELEFLRQTKEQPEAAALELLDSVFNDADRRGALFDRLQANPQAFVWIWTEKNYKVLDMLWDLEIVPRNLEIPFLKAQEPRLEIFILLNGEDREFKLIEKYGMNTDAMVVIWNTFCPFKTQKYIWRNVIVQRKEEISFLSKFENLIRDLIYLSDFLTCPAIKKDRKALIKKYSNDALALAVIWKTLHSLGVRRKLWDKTIVCNNLELQFLSQIDQPGAATCDSVSRHLVEMRFLNDKTRQAALEEKYPEARDQIAAFMDQSKEHFHY